mmetsp:Transcript_11998/g.18079  ORF Transcript_11998/g.18079 Transcript_11998/m.18079 type:complete len:382 (-) Transcript_11998:232-1377(-)|eukprot:CAMPEP_0196809344 /NCGR_PEP_ID=MMETSP1362-20130617/9297_1 /TAXON_ID=163516 /ORGANISM="Leptocylindrus danicus, Strain CCMP1856" /LENGTH=381 /DNA_ID=CAMNT_0042184017 /DNA_START=77 /DNA_END=1222 /DNA_ORIENTATION=+
MRAMERIWLSICLSLFDITVVAFTPVTTAYTSVPSSIITTTRTTTRTKKTRSACSSTILQETASASTYECGCIDWSGIDATYLITCPNADVDGARRESSKNVLQKVGLLQDKKTTIEEFDTDDEDRIRGCYTSHISVLTKAYNKFRRNKDAKILVCEDNIALTENIDSVNTMNQVNQFMSGELFDVMHLAYISYVPDLTIQKTDNSKVVRLLSGPGSSLGTTAYIISMTGIEAVLKEHKERGYYAAIPDVMAKLFPESRYAAYPVPFHRASKVKSLVNPQLDSLREVLFVPAIFLNVQTVLAETGLNTNALLPLTIILLLLVSAISGRTTFDAALQILNTGSYDGFLLVPAVSSIFSLFSLAIVGQGIALAPKPPPAEEVN